MGIKGESIKYVIKKRWKVKLVKVHLP